MKNRIDGVRKFLAAHIPLAVYADVCIRVEKEILAARTEGEARGWERARAECRRIAYNNEAEWVCEQIDALDYSPTPTTPSALVGHLDNGSEVRVHLTQDTAPAPTTTPVGEGDPIVAPMCRCGIMIMDARLWHHRADCEYHAAPTPPVPPEIGKCAACGGIGSVAPSQHTEDRYLGRIDCPACHGTGAPPSPEETHDPA